MHTTSYELTPLPPPRTRRVAAAMTFGTLTAGAAALGRISVPVSRGPWYRALRKPSYQPPSSLFPPVWTVLYALIATSGYRVWRSRRPTRRRALGFWGLQLALNAAWTPLFFGMKRPRAALADLSLLLPAIGAYAWTARRADKAAAWLVLPYLGWSAFGFALNSAIVRRNANTLARR
jgi:benzodiazapine receptor